MGEVIQFRPRPKIIDSQKAYSLHRRASKIDEDSSRQDEAASLYLQAISLDPTLAIAYTNLGNIHFRKKDLSAAKTLYEKAVAIDPHQSEALYNLGFMLLESGKAQESIPLFERALDADETFADAYFNLAMAFENVGMIAEAKVNWREYIKLEPEGTWSEIARRHLG